MTYRELLAALSELSNEELDLTATVYVSSFDEYFAIEHGNRCRDGVLDEDYPIMVTLNTTENNK